MKKAAIQIVLALVVIGLAFVVYRQLTIPLQFDKEVEKRSAAVIDRIKDIRSAERAYKQVYDKYCGNFDSLIAFVLTDSMVYERSFGSADDSVAVARGLVKSEQFKMAVIDTAFGTKKLTPAQVQQLRYIPYSADQEYILEAGALETESGCDGAGVRVPRSVQGLSLRPESPGTREPDRRA